MGRKIGLKLSMLTVFLLLVGFGLPAAESVCGHISFVDKEALVIGADGSENRAVVNLPVVPGDTVATPANGRCELQFDNGTIVRLDKATRLRLASVLAPSLTSNWEITTLELEAGQLYALPQSYGREIFQIITPNAAVNLKSRVRATVRLDADGGTSFFSDGGKFQLLYGADSRSLKKVTVKANRPLAITAAQVPAQQVETRDIEFMGWNEYVDNHYKELHYGISKVPPKLKFGNSALTYWAEKWSSLYGEWIYDELFGYVWRPADERFAYAARPFFHASFTRLNGGLFLVPQEAWGWVPAHMGTWVWMKRGWTWIPGTWFHNGIVDCSGMYSFSINAHYYSFPTFDFYWQKYFYRQPGWPGRLELPGPVISLIKKVVKVPDNNESKRIAIEKTRSSFTGVKLPPATALPTPGPGNLAAAAPAPGSKPQDLAGQAGGNWTGRDWNPDSRWAVRSGYSIRYSGSSNAVVCPELKLSSDNLSGLKRMMLRAEASRRHLDSSSGRANSGQQGNSSNGSASGTAVSNQGQSGTGEKDNGKK